MRSVRVPFFKLLLYSAAILLPAFPFSLGAAPASPFPEIEVLGYSDLLYRQLQDDISAYHRAAASGTALPPLVLYSYRIGEKEDILTIAAASGLPYDTIASLNRISGTSENIAGRNILLPGWAGLFIPEEPESDLELIMHSWRGPYLREAERIAVAGAAGNQPLFYRHLTGESFHKVERAYFLGILFFSPVSSGVITSGFGMRSNPFSGRPVFHDGIDIAAPEGSPVRAAREGVVTAAGFSNVYGNYLEIAHAGGYSTFYAHLNKIFVELHSGVNSSMIIAEVGNTGRSTGPHLHFEIRRNGEPRDPQKLTPGLE